MSSRHDDSFDHVPVNVYKNGRFIPPLSFPAPSAPTYVGAEGAAFTGAETDVVVPVPSGVQDGDLLIAIINGGYFNVVSHPAGWTHVSGSPHFEDQNFDNYLNVLTRVASSEPADYTWSAIVAAPSRAGAIIAFRNAEVDFVGIEGDRDSRSPGTSPMYSGTDVDSDVYVTGLSITQEWADGGDSIIIPTDGFTEVVDVRDVGVGGHLQVQYGDAYGPGAVAANVNISAAAPDSTHSWVMLGLKYV